MDAWDSSDFAKGGFTGHGRPVGPRLLAGGYYE